MDICPSLRIKHFSWPLFFPSIFIIFWAGQTVSCWDWQVKPSALSFVWISLMCASSHGGCRPQRNTEETLQKRKFVLEPWPIGVQQSHSHWAMVYMLAMRVWLSVPSKCPCRAAVERADAQMSEGRSQRTWSSVLKQLGEAQWSGIEYRCLEMHF